MLAGRPSPRAASFAHQAMGIVLRDAGRLPEALTEVQRALRLARRCDADRTADVLATLGLTLAWAGRTAKGLRHLEEALPLTSRTARPRLLLRRAQALYLAGRYPEALRDLQSSIQGSHRLGDRLWEARGLNNRSVVHLAMGAHTLADADARRAEPIFVELGQLLESAHCLHNRAHAAHARGDLPAALVLMDDVAQRYGQTLGLLPVDFTIDHTNMLVTAGLATEARTLLGPVLDGEVPRAKEAELLLTAARAALADEDTDVAISHAVHASGVFARQHRPRWAQRATLLALQAESLAAAASGTPRRPRDHGPQAPPTPPSGPEHRPARTTSLARRAADMAASLSAQGSAEAPTALLLHGRVALAAGRHAEAEVSLALAARSRHTGPPLGRAAAWLAAALLARQRQDRRGLLLACRGGLDAVDEHRGTLGDLELRALATGHGLELATLAVEESLRAGTARDLLWWTERWRATALVSPSAGRPDDPGLERAVAALRDVARRLDATAGGDAATATLTHERARREADVRRAYRHLRGSGGARGFDLTGVLDALGGTVLLSLVNVGGTLHAVTVARGQVRRREVGPLDAALREAEFARFALRRAAHGRRSDLGSTAGRLQAALLGWPLSTTGPDRVVLVPPADLLTAPWGLLPAFADTVLTVSPSATLWLAARQSRASGGHVALVTGPGLSTGESEVTRLSPMYAAARSVGGAEATVAGALSVLDGARLAHVAAHGTFRADAPLFSSLLMADGPLAVHDLDQLARPPRAMVLSACDSGGAAPIGAHEALGLVSSLLAMGTSTVLASVVPVNDRATLTVMNHVHTVAGAGGSLAEGLLAARRAGRDDPLVAATTAAFTAWGA